MKTETWYAWMCVKASGNNIVGFIYWMPGEPNMDRRYFKPVIDGEHQKSVEVGEI